MGSVFFLVIEFFDIEIDIEGFVVFDLGVVKGVWCDCCVVGIFDVVVVGE